MKRYIGIMAAALLVSGNVHAFSASDLKNSIDRSDKCKSGDDSCKTREHLKGAARVAAITIAAKIITDMVIEYRTKKISDEDTVAKEYKVGHDNNLPEQPIASLYTTNTLPSKVVQPGKKVTIQSDMVVVPGRAQKDTLIEERLSIFDNEDNSKELKSLTKTVNEETKRAGRYNNEFTFTLPEGLPQGVYPIKTSLLINGKAAQTTDNDIQLVLNVDQAGQMTLVASAF
ncbi:MAG TPA: hypothetical protein VN030_10835 [Cellvibrio sp.]|nr:hypothetical protein [Cellvibrio sp.]